MFLFICLDYTTYIFSKINNLNGFMSCSKEKYSLNKYYICFYYSRAHTIVSINFAQNSIVQKMTKHSVINLVDLAGRFVI